MKNGFILLILVILLSACGTARIDGNKSTPIIEQVNFNPELVKTGDQFGGWLLEKLNPSNIGYEAQFSGSLIARGLITRTEMDDEYFPDTLKFTPFEEDAKLFPKSVDDERYVWMIVENRDDLLRELELKYGEEKSVTIKVEEYRINYLPTEAANTVRFVSLE